MIDPTLTPDEIVAARVLVTSATDTDGRYEYVPIGTFGVIVWADMTTVLVAAASGADEDNHQLYLLPRTTVSVTDAPFSGRVYIDQDTAAHALFRHDGTGYPPPDQWTSDLLRLIATADEDQLTILSSSYPAYVTAINMVKLGYTRSLRKIAKDGAL